MSAMLMKLEADAKADVVNHRTHGSRAADLRRAETEIAARQPRDPNCIFYDMAPAKWRRQPAQNSQEAIVRYIAGRSARR